MEIKIGDIVTLKKGGPYMIVDYIIGHNLPQDCEVYFAPGIKKGSVICIWSTENGTIQGTMYKPEELKIVNAYVYIS